MERKLKGFEEVWRRVTGGGSLPEPKPAAAPPALMPGKRRKPGRRYEGI